MGRPLYLRHDASLGYRQALANGQAHPESPERIAAVEAELARRDWLGWEVREAPAAAEDVLVAAHGDGYVERLRAAADMPGGTRFTEDTIVDAGAWRAALHAAGGAVALAEALLAGDASTGFSAQRPPGHHADGTKPMGFCVLNNVAIAARHALDSLGARRVFILDWDVHHGNGTNDIFRRSDEVLFASIHGAGLFPGTGALSELGDGPGEGYSVNLPVPVASEPGVWLSLLEHVVIPVAEQFRPDLVLISAGYDALEGDPTAAGALEVGTFAEMARQVRDLGDACGAPVGAVLEGGYVPERLAECVVATMEALAGDVPADMVAPDPIYTPRAASHIGHYWDL